MAELSMDLLLKQRAILEAQLKPFKEMAEKKKLKGADKAKYEVLMQSLKENSEQIQSMTDKITEGEKKERKEKPKEKEAEEVVLVAGDKIMVANGSFDDIADYITKANFDRVTAEINQSMFMLNSLVLRTNILRVAKKDPKLKELLWHFVAMCETAVNVERISKGSISEDMKRLVRLYLTRFASQAKETKFTPAQVVSAFPEMAVLYRLSQAQTWTEVFISNGIAQLNMDIEMKKLAFAGAMHKWTFIIQGDGSTGFNPKLFFVRAYNDKRDFGFPKEFKTGMKAEDVEEKGEYVKFKSEMTKANFILLINNMGKKFMMEDLTKMERISAKCPEPGNEEQLNEWIKEYHKMLFDLAKVDKSWKERLEEWGYTVSDKDVTKIYPMQ